MTNVTANLTKSLKLDAPLLVIKRSELSDPTEKITVKEYQQIASYNWWGKPEKPVIVVPGAPKRFVRWEGGQLVRDRGELMADENHYMMPEYPMEPLFQAIILCTDENDNEFKFQDRDIVTDRNNLRKLFSFFEEGINRRDSTFRIDVQRIGRLICLIRCQETDKQAAPPVGRPTFGQDFETKCAKPDQDIYKGSYRQIVGYKLGELRLIVRFEVDCADYDKSEKIPVKSNKSPTVGGEASASASMDDLMKKLSLSDVLNPEKLPGSDLSVIKSGDRFKYHLVELTTRIRTRSFPDHTWPQMFFSGTETLVVGWQHFGRVNLGNGIQVCPIEDVEERYGGYPSDRLKCLHNLLAKIVEFVREQDEDKTVAIFWQKGDDDIKIVEVVDADRSAVPDGLKRFVKEN